MLTNLIASLKESLAGLSPSGHQIFKFNVNGSATAGKLTFIRLPEAKGAMSQFNITSLIDGRIPQDTIVDVARFMVKADNGDSLVFRFYAHRVNASEICYNFALTRENPAVKKFDVITYRKLAVLKSMAVDFTFRVDWESGRIDVGTPTKLQSTSSQNIQYSASYDFDSVPSKVYDLPLSVSNRQENENKPFNLVRSVDVKTKTYV